VDIHEYQAKEILAGYGVPIGAGGLAYSPEQASYRCSEIGGSVWVVKAQIHSGARGKAGGIVVCKSEDEVWSAADELLGKKLITHQTGPNGKICSRLYIEEGCNIDREIYLAFVLDRAAERVTVVASAEGGMEIEQLAVEKPESIIKISVEPAVGMQAFQARELAFALGLDKSQINQAVTTFLGCYRAMRDLDANMVEINPLVVTKEGKIIAVDAKMGFDENALFRHPNISELRDKSQEDPREMRAADRGLNYVGLDGNIGCIINGAGLAMATMDMIKHAGGEPANFLDIGGSSNPDKVVTALEIITADPNVKSILFNIFGGITRCDDVANGIVEATKRIELDMPITIRLTGTNEEQAVEILRNNGFTAMTDMDEVVKRGVELAASAEMATK